MTGIEPASSAWEAEALPLDDTRCQESHLILSDSEALREADDRSGDFLYIGIDDGKVIRLIPAD